MADALPTIDEILAGLAGGTYDVQQVRVWIDLHVGTAVEAAFDRDRTAEMAMQALMADRKFMQEASNTSVDCCAVVAAAAYRQADAMETARNS